MVIKILMRMKSADGIATVIRQKIYDSTYVIEVVNHRFDTVRVEYEDPCKARNHKVMETIRLMHVLKISVLCFQNHGAQPWRRRTFVAISY